ncbi:MAG: glycosyltransferase family 2 protein [Deltaproteobacteria bacterium]|nr:glycosyltransferase family 2 protein [Deltaproteobacteria bacterium]
MMKTNQLVFAIILPAYNEESTIAQTIESFHSAVPEAHIYVIDNNSNDATGKIAADLLNRLGCQGGLISEARQGKGNALRRAFQTIDADVYLLADADLTYPAGMARELIAPIINDEADMVVGDRRSGGNYGRENKRPLHGFGNALVQWLVNYLFRSKLADIMSGYRALSRVFVKNYPVLVEGFEIETDMTLHALHKRFKIVEIPVMYRDRPEGSVSKLNTFADGTKVIFTILQILRYYRPLMFFGGAAVAFCAAGLLCSIPVINDWINFRYIYHVPLAILATGLEITAIMMLSIGLILDSLVHQHLCEYERSLLKSRLNHN